MKNNIVGWFEIPVSNMAKAMKFYETVFDLKLNPSNMGPFEMAIFPMAEKAPGAAGALVFHKEYKPSSDGTLVYFTSPSGDLNNELAKIESAGGRVFRPKTLIAEDIGYLAIFGDTEGNRLALHSMK
jgi:predicted enzyme related to lactoylglutathione lyase